MQWIYRIPVEHIQHIKQFYLISEIIQQLKMHIETYFLSKDLYEKRDDLITEMRVLKPHIIKW